VKGTVMTHPTIELKPTGEPLAQAERAAILSNPGFGRYFTDHMVTIRYSEGRGWYDAELRPYGPIQLDPDIVPHRYFRRGDENELGPGCEAKEAG